MNDFGKDNPSAVTFPRPEYPSSGRYISSEWTIEHGDRIGSGSVADIYDCWTNRNTGQLFVAKEFSVTNYEFYRDEVAAFLRARGVYRTWSRCLTTERINLHLGTLLSKSE